MIYRTEDIYSKIKIEKTIESNNDFMSLLKSENSPITDDVLLDAFSELRLTVGQDFKLDQICFLFGNGCSRYAGTKPTTDFDIHDAVGTQEAKDISDVLERLKDKSMEEQLNDLLTIQAFYRITNNPKEEVISATISQIKAYLLNTYVNSINYKKLNLHEILFLKLRSYGCMSKVSIYTPNYDLALEYILDKYGVEYSNGFSGFVNRRFNPKSFHMAKSTKLIKVHGSISWVFDVQEKVIKELQPHFSADGIVDLINTDHLLIYPTEQKLYETYNAPYSELMRGMLDEFESRRNVILVIGYRYADEHINDILLKAVANPNNIFYFFDYSDESCEFIKRMMELSQNTHNINILIGNFLGDFSTFVKYILPANAEKTDEEKILELLHKVMEKKDVE